MVFLLLSHVAMGQALNAEEVEEALFDMPDVRFEKSDIEYSNLEGSWNLRIRQPLDHQHPEKGFFYQRVYLSHRDGNLPVVMVTEGMIVDGIIRVN